MAKPVKRHSNERVAAPIEAAAPPLFDPYRFYTDEEIAAVIPVCLRTYKRWKAKGEAAPTVKFNRKTHRTPGHEANRWWQRRLGNPEPETA